MVLKKAFALLLIMILIASVPTASLWAQPLSIWVVRNQITSPEKVEQVINLARTVGASRLYVQVVGRMDAYYKSDILPRTEALSDQPLDFDPLDMILRLAEPYGIKISAWMNVFYVWPFASRPKDPRHVVNMRPEWITYDSFGRSLLSYSRADGTVEGLFLDPGIPEVRQYVASVAEEIARKYMVDEVHLDFIRYPYPIFGYNPIALQHFQKFLSENYKDASLLTTLEAFDKFRIQQINLTVLEIYRRVKQNGKNLSAAVFANYASDALKLRFQDWVAWLKGGYIDYVCLMAYSPYPSDVLTIARTTIKNVGDLSKVRIGIGAMNMKKFPERIVEVGEALKKLGPNEIVVFSFEDLLDDKVREAVMTVAGVPKEIQQIPQATGTEIVPPQPMVPEVTRPLGGI